MLEKKEIRISARNKEGNTALIKARNAAHFGAIPGREAKTGRKDG
jgi:hypothetical protein